jgi:DNA polymerase III subunit gamma/tau
MSFYRTYRPQVIDEIDNVSVRETLLSLLSKPKKDLPHAFLFSGPRGAGKTTAARVIAKLFNCEKSTPTGPCGTCTQCITIGEGRNLDVLELDAASNRGIDEIRTLREGIGLSPSAGEFKVYIIDEVHMLTTEAFNALLKTLEEPPAHAVFVLATTDPQKVPVTIVSRCVGFVFSKATPGELIHALSRIVKKEKIAIDDDALQLLSESVDGSFRDGVKLLEQTSFHKGKITLDTVRATLSLATTKDIAEFSSALALFDAKKCLDMIQNVVDNGRDIKAFLTQLLQQFQKMLRMRATGVAQDNDYPTQLLMEAIRRFSQAYGEMRLSPIAQLPLELAVVEFCEHFKQSAPQKQVEKEPVAAITPDKPIPQKPQPEVVAPVVAAPVPEPAPVDYGALTAQKLTEHWADIIAELKPNNHSVAGVMRSTRPLSVKDGIVTIEAFYTFHKDKLSEVKTRETLSGVLKKLFGEVVKVEVVLGKK